MSIIWSLRNPEPVSYERTVGFWKMNDDAANKIVRDVSKGDNEGESQVNTEDMHVAGKIEGAFDFDGAADYVTVLDDVSLQLSDAITIAAWVKTTQKGAAVKKGFVSKMKSGGLYNGPEMGLYGDGADDGVGYFHMGGSYGGAYFMRGKTIINDDDWHFVLATFGAMNNWGVKERAKISFVDIDTGLPPVSGTMIENIVWDSVTNRFWCVMIYQGEIFMAYADTTGQTKAAIEGGWTIESNQILTGGAAPCIKKFGIYWYVYYKKVADGCIWCKIAGAVNGPYFTPVKVLDKSGGAWDANRVDEPYVFLKDGVYHMLFMGEAQGVTYEKTGLATCSTPDGTFNHNENNPVLSGLTNEHGDNWDGGTDRAADPYAFQIGDKWYVGVTACEVGKVNWDIGYFETEDFVTYQPVVFNTNPILYRRAGEFDAYAVLRGAVIEVEDTYYVAYAARKELVGDTLYKGSLGKLYFAEEQSWACLMIDGIGDMSKKFTAWDRLLNEETNLWIGRSYTATQKFDGIMDIVYMLNSRLTFEQALFLYNSGAGTETLMKRMLGIVNGVGELLVTNVNEQCKIAGNVANYEGS